MASLLLESRPKHGDYLDRSQFDSIEEQNAAKATSSTLYVGGLNARTLEDHIHELFSKCGSIRRVVMGLHRIEKTPCGFCFVEYIARDDAVNAVHMFNRLRVDGHMLKVEMDPGFKEGRQFGRARSGGQVRDERNNMRTGFGGAGAERGSFHQNQGNMRGGFHGSYNGPPRRWHRGGRGGFRGRFNGGMQRQFPPQHGGRKRRYDDDSGPLTPPPAQSFDTFGGAPISNNYNNNNNNADDQGSSKFSRRNGPGSDSD